ncbi:MAG: hypothetical protein M3458_03420 [Acidobacteriota bacterium]|nr:hypothetical protein [Acidobacteriota bacterium]
MSQDELQTLYETVKVADDALLTELFGNGESVRYKRVQRTSNSYFDVTRADAAYAEVERMEARLTEEEQERLFGIGETDVYDLDEIRAEIGAR